jgi:hypothetical protein
MKIEILDQTRKVLKDQDGEEFIFETAIVQIGEGHKWLFMTNNDLLVCYKCEMIPGVDFKPIELERLAAEHFFKNKKKK